MELPAAILDRLVAYGQEHLVRWWDELRDPDQQSLLGQIDALDLPLVTELAAAKDLGRRGDLASVKQAARAAPPDQLVRLPQSKTEREQWDAAIALGCQRLREGRVGAVLVAGGQGTRLGSPQPKGMFRIGPVSRKSLFQLHCEQIRARSRGSPRAIPYFIMTSDATHADTLAYFEQHRWFGLNRDDVCFFRQGSWPAVSDRDGRILMAEKHRISTCPDGHGGILRALHSAGLIAQMRDRGIEDLYYHQVDNPAANVCDPAFLGLHHRQQSQFSTKVVAKETAEERMGVVVSVGGRTEIIEYSNLPPDRARATAADGSLLLWAGNTGMHVFDREFLEQLAADDRLLPFHRAHKAVPHLDDRGQLVVPETPNAWKFEQFIFDALTEAERTLVVEADRVREFLPVKNQSGKDSPETARAGLLRLHREWLETAGAVVADGVQVEISPLAALGPDDLRQRIRPGERFDTDCVIE